MASATSSAVPGPPAGACAANLSTPSPIAASVPLVFVGPVLTVFTRMPLGNRLSDRSGTWRATAGLSCYPLFIRPSLNRHRFEILGRHIGVHRIYYGREHLTYLTDRA